MEGEKEKGEGGFEERKRGKGGRMIDDKGLLNEIVGNHDLYKNNGDF